MHDIRKFEALAIDIDGKVVCFDWLYSYDIEFTGCTELPVSGVFKLYIEEWQDFVLRLFANDVIMEVFSIVTQPSQPKGHFFHVFLEGINFKVEKIEIDRS